MVMNFPGDFEFSVDIPEFKMAPPTSTFLVIPEKGPRGLKGPPGDSSEVLGFTYVGTVPAAVHLIEHGLPYNPGGITCLDADGATVIGWSVTHPAPGFTEITFGVDITPTIYLS